MKVVGVNQNSEVVGRKNQNSELKIQKSSVELRNAESGISFFYGFIASPSDPFQKVGCSNLKQKIFNA